MKKKNIGLRGSLTNYGDDEFSYFLRKSFSKSMGYGAEELDRPIVGIVNTSSGMVSCHGTVPHMVDAVKRGVIAAGGLPVDFPTISLGEPFLNPTSMLFRNLMAIDTEEMIRAHPIDSVVLIGGCDKTVPAQLMAAATVNIPTVQVVTGPMMTGSYRGQRLGACTDCRRLWGEYRAGRIEKTEIDQISNHLMPTAGTCMVMGTASTMACIAEALGMMVSGGATIPAVNADRLRNASDSGLCAVKMIANDGPLPSDIMTPASFTNALRVLLAIGGSTNAVIHLAAIAGRLGLEFDYAAFDKLGKDTPVLVDLKPSGTHYMEDLDKAGGMAAVLRELAPFLNHECMTVSGKTLGEELDKAPVSWSQDVVRSVGNPLYKEGGIAVLTGNLAPDGAIIKHSAATSDLLSHEGRAIVFESLEDLEKRIDDPALDVTSEDILVLRNVGPKGAPGMPEAGYIPIPKKLAKQGVKDMVRISDARMSGTAFGTIVLHLCPESAIGGPLALVQNGDKILLNVPLRRLDLLISKEEFEARQLRWKPPKPAPNSDRGWLALHLKYVQQANQGCDLDILSSTTKNGCIPV